MGIVVGIVSLFVTVSAIAGNWPSFRGPNGSGLGTGSPPVSWNVDSGENIKWKVPVTGLAHSSPIVWGDRVFITTAVSLSAEATLSTGWLDGTGDSADDTGEWEWRVICIDRGTGKTLWEKAAHRGAPKHKRHIKATQANSTPATDGSNVVALFGSEGLYCYDMEGNLRWKKDLGPLDAGPHEAESMQWGFAGSPVIHEDKVLIQCDVRAGSYWLALDLKTGEEKLRVERGDVCTWTTPSIYRAKSGPAIVCNGWKKIAGYDLSTGKELWTLRGGGDVPVPRPVIADDLLVVTTGHGKRPIYVLRSDATGDLTPEGETKPDGVVWWHGMKGSYMPTPIVVGDVVYVADDNGIFTGFDLRTGAQLLRSRLPGGGKSTYSASAVAADGRVYVTAEDGQVDVLAAAREYKHLATNQMGEVCMATPAISDGLLLIRGQRHLFAIGK